MRSGMGFSRRYPRDSTPVLIEAGTAGDAAFRLEMMPAPAGKKGVT